jgi:hypothetical protein
LDRNCAFAGFSPALERPFLIFIKIAAIKNPGSGVEELAKRIANWHRTFAVKHPSLPHQLPPNSALQGLSAKSKFLAVHFNEALQRSSPKANSYQLKSTP